MASSKLGNTEIRSFRVTLNLEQGLGPVMGCKLQTEKVLLNLMQNGIDSMDEAGVCPFSFAISVCSATGRAMPHITVRDCCPGGIVHRIFEPFFSTEHNGLGLGLAISRSLIEAQDGQLWIDPEDGPGAVFHFTLPFCRA